MSIRITNGRLSDLAKRDQRADWSKLKSRIAALEPGDTIKVRCSSDSEVPRMRSTILTIGSRVHTGDWKLSTRTDGRVITAFLFDKSK